MRVANVGIIRPAADPPQSQTSTLQPFRLLGPSLPPAPGGPVPPAFGGLFVILPAERAERQRSFQQGLRAVEDAELAVDAAE